MEKYTIEYTTEDNLIKNSFKEEGELFISLEKIRETCLKEDKYAKDRIDAARKLCTVNPGMFLLPPPDLLESLVSFSQDLGEVVEKKGEDIEVEGMTLEELKKFLAPCIEKDGKKYYQINYGK